MKIDTDMSAVDAAVQDAFICGAGVVKIWFHNGQISADHVPIKQFSEFADELKWRASQINEENKQ